MLNRRTMEKILLIMGTLLVLDFAGKWISTAA
jgi:hypothetical protein